MNNDRCLSRLGARFFHLFCFISILVLSFGWIKPSSAYHQQGLTSSASTSGPLGDGEEAWFTGNITVPITATASISPTVYSDIALLTAQAYLATSIYLPFMSRDYCTGFSDDFSNPASGWDESESDHVLSEYTMGEFLVHTKKSGHLYLYRAPSCVLDNYTVELDVRWQEETGKAYGLIFDVQQNFSSYYLFIINADDQMYRLYRRTASESTNIKAWTRSSAIHTGFSSNHLMVTRSGENITLYVNGVELGMWSDNSIAGAGGVGIVSKPYSNHPITDSLYDNFNLSGVPPTNSDVGAAMTGVDTQNAPSLKKIVVPEPED